VVKRDEIKGEPREGGSRCGAGAALLRERGRRKWVKRVIGYGGEKGKGVCSQK
jgi:hypothetical protein